MHSITKAQLTHEQIKELIKQAFGESTESVSIIELTDGMYNAAFRIMLSDNLNTVLKVSPPEHIKVMRYEKSIMETEVYTLKQVGARTSMPVPGVYFFDNTRTLIKSDYIFMSCLEGTPLNKIRDVLGEEALKVIHGTLGAFAAEMKSLAGDYFGSIAQPEKRFASWSDAFRSMITELVDDAADIGEKLPLSGAELLGIVEEQRDILNLVEKPAFVHKDLWEGNVFIDPSSKKITGIVDFERALYADSLLEPVCAFMLENNEFMYNYLGRTKLDFNERMRTVLYRIYLQLIMIIESRYRNYSDEGFKIWAGEQLEQSIKELNNLKSRHGDEIDKR